MSELSNDEIRRYSRHLILPEVGLAGQRKIRRASVLCVGAGGLGSPILLYLAAAGIGRLGMVDFDAVEVSNLQRQIIHRMADVGRSKTLSAKEAVAALNPDVEVVVHDTRLSRENALEVLAPYDIVVDGTDNFPTRYLTNDACVLLKKPNVYGTIFRFEGQASVFAPHLGGPCYRCLFPEPPPPGLVPSCAEGGVLGVLPGVIGCLQATEILKLVLNKGAPLVGRMLLFDALEMRFREIKVRRDPQCPLCGVRPSITELVDYEKFCGLKSSPSAMAVSVDQASIDELKQALADSAASALIVDVREPHERDLAGPEGMKAIPLSLLPVRFGELDPTKTIYLVCQAGARSLQAAQFLRERGFRSVKNVVGGLDAWHGRIDSAAPDS
jgi:adenylyltransferase/sulfurtransferase